MMDTAAEHWDTTIRPQQPWWRLHLREFWNYRDLLGLLVKRDLTAQYKQTVLGPLWLVAQPLLTTLVYATMFGLLARWSQPGIPSVLFYLSGIVPWTYFSGVVNRTSRTFVSNTSVLTKVYFPRLIMPVSSTLSALASFLIQLVLVGVFIAYYTLFRDFVWAPHAGLLVLPIWVLLMSLLGLGTGILVSALSTKYRDLGLLVNYAMQLLMFASPVIFPLSLVKDRSPELLPYLKANPMTPVIEGVRTAFFGGQLDVAGLGYATLFAVLLLLAGVAVFQRVERSFADVV
jgi:lipopolysaccharide transport system permease protein